MACAKNAPLIPTLDAYLLMTNTAIILALKLSLVPSLIGAVTLAGHRWGPGVAGWLSAFPVVSGPILFFIAMEQGPSFASNAATATLSAVLAILVFGASYAWAALYFSWKGSLALSFLAYFFAVACLNTWAPSLLLAAPAVVAALIIAPRFYPKATASVMPAKSPPPRSDIIWRMAAGAVLTLAVTYFASSLGSRLSGLFAMFPVIGSVLVVFSHRLFGGAFVVLLLRGMVLGYFAFATFCFSLSLALASLSIGYAFLLAIVLAVICQVVSRFYLQHASNN